MEVGKREGIVSDIHPESVEATACKLEQGPYREMFEPRVGTSVHVLTYPWEVSLMLLY